MKIGIIGAMEEELVPIRAILQNLVRQEAGSRVYWTGRDYGHTLFLTRCDPGKVNAVIAAQQLIDLFGVEAIFNMGSSGALDPALELGDLVIATEFIQHDFDVTMWGLQPGELLFDIVMTPGNGQLQFRSQQVFRGDAALAALALAAAQRSALTPLAGHTPTARLGRVLSGDQFISHPERARALWDRHRGLCTDMEAAAIAQACELNRVPFLCVRAISDKADHSAVMSFSDFLLAATANYGRIFEDIFQNL